MAEKYAIVMDEEKYRRIRNVCEWLDGVDVFSVDGMNFKTDLVYDCLPSTYVEIKGRRIPKTWEICKYIDEGLVIGIQNSMSAFKLEPKRIIKNGDYLTVVWGDKTVTVIKRKPDDSDDIYSAFAQALMKRMCGSTSHAHKWIDSHLEEHKPKKKNKKNKKKETVTFYDTNNQPVEVLEVEE